MTIRFLAKKSEYFLINSRQYKNSEIFSLNNANLTILILFGIKNRNFPGENCADEYSRYTFNLLDFYKVSDRGVARNFWRGDFEIFYKKKILGERGDFWNFFLKTLAN